MFFLWLIVGVVAISVLFLALSIKLEIEDFEFNIPELEDGFFSTKSKFKLKIYLFKKIRIANINLKKFKKSKIRYSQIKNMLDRINKKGNRGNLKIREIISNIDINAEKIDLEVNVGLENAATTAIIVGSLYVFIETFIRSKIKNIKEQKCDIKPNYQKDMLYIKFDGIFEVDMWNIINMVLKHN